MTHTILGIAGSTQFFSSLLVHKSVKYCFHGTLVILLAVSLAAAQEAPRKQVKTQYFPVGGLSTEPWSDQFRTKWYSEQLKALQEPSLWEASKTQKTQSCRFLWLRTFHHPVAIRIDAKADGTALLTRKITSGAGGYKPGKLVENETHVLTVEQTNWVFGKIETLNFWNLPSIQEDRGVDGAEWIVEGVRDGKYHIVDRWSPQKGEIRALGLLFLEDLEKMKFPSKEVY